MNDSPAQIAIPLFELNEHLRRVVALNFAEAVWVQAEIAAHQTSRGHHFLSLVEKGVESDQIIAQADAVVWNRTFNRLRRKHGKAINAILQAGLATQLKVKLDFHERFGLKLIVEEVDVAYTVGQLALKRRATLETLQAEGNLDKNGNLPLPSVLQRIAVLSSERAAGLQDFKQHLQQNPYGYQFQVSLFPTAMQGQQVVKELSQQLKKINRYYEDFDVIVIVRGGGARLDLTAFDDLELCRAIANAKLPVFTGIGHDIDETILDKVAYQSLKTPTAVVDFIVQHHLFFEAKIAQQFNMIQTAVSQYLHYATSSLNQLEQQLQWQSQQQLNQASQQLDNMEQQLPLLVQNKLNRAEQQLEHLASVTQLLSLESTLKRGFGLVKQAEKNITSIAGIEKKEPITIVLHDGGIETQII